MTDDLQRLLAGDCRAHHLLDVLCVTYFQRVHLACSKSRKVGERQSATMHMHAAEFGAAVQGWKHFSRIKQALGVERAFQPLLLVEIDPAEHFPPQIAPLDA